jgi:hypothetical protein
MRMVGLANRCGGIPREELLTTKGTKVHEGNFRMSDFPSCTFVSLVVHAFDLLPR